MPPMEHSKLKFREMLETETEIVMEMLKDGSRETENRLLLYAMTRPAALLLMAVGSSALRFALSSFVAALLAPVLCAAALLRLALRRRARPPRARPWVAVYDGEDVCGCAAFDPRPGGLPGPPAAELCRLAVSRWHRRSGVATFLLARFEDWARAHGYRRATLRVDLVNRAAIALFEKHGYKPSPGGGVGVRLCSSISIEYAKDL
ncbi:N-acetyltransferase 14 [Carcharodon carcharias]|uniref:N-acetyltransferase 14 n=1 Tax=Carcharodon carcharias TaxID=13397 RepID=UPI001B7F1FFC|nr:N-acetyltransferase 14 [Carcharodon carcharias]